MGSLERGVGDMLRQKWWTATVLPRVLKVKSLEHHFVCLRSVKIFQCDSRPSV